MAGKDIRDFFSGGGGGGESATQKVQKSTKRKNVVEDDDDDFELEEPPKKKSTAPKAIKKDDSEEIEASEFFASSGSRRPKRRAAQQPIVIDEDSDIDILDAPEVTPSVSKPSPKKPVRAKAQPQSPVSKPKATKAAKPNAKPATQQATGEGAEAILMTIPDAPLPEVTGKKFSFADFKKSGADANHEGSGEFHTPEAAVNCLAGMTFVFTGNLPNLGREEGQNLVKRYGGKVVSAVSGNTTCVVLGDQAGPKKIEKIQKLNIKAITEEGFAELLGKMPADGGGGELAQKALAKAAKEDAKIQEDAEAMAAEIDRNEKKQKQKAKKVESTGGSAPRDAASNQLWTVRYAPQSRKDICGNKSQVDRLDKWLQNFDINKKQGFTNKADGGDMRAVLISGPPGIGKTSAAHVIAKSLGFDVIESNASDARSKKLLSETISQRLDNSSLNGFYSENSDHQVKKVCLILDEVDGMSAGDRGGVGAMAAICRQTKVPIILVCNDKRLPKMRPFDRVTYDLPFRRPRAAEIRARIMTICHREGLSIEPAAADRMCESTGSDIRQVINMISTYSRTGTKMKFDESKKLTEQWAKNTALKPFDITSRLLSTGLWAASTNASLNDKLDLYFFDHDFAPLFIQENYLNSKPSKASNTVGASLELAARASESISDGDLVDKLIHGPQQQWSLMPMHGITSTVIPSFHMNGTLSGFPAISFPSYLGQLSKGNKYKRLLQEIQSHVRLRVSADKQELRQQYMPLFTDRLLNPLIDQQAEAIEDVIELMEEYYLTKEDWDVIMELSVGKNNAQDRLGKVETKTKSAFTRAYNSSDHPVPFMTSVASAATGKTSGTKDVPDFEGAFEQEEMPEDEKKVEADEDDINKDKYIKAKKPKKAPAKKAAPKKRAKK